MESPAICFFREKRRVFEPAPSWTTRRVKKNGPSQQDRAHPSVSIKIYFKQYLYAISLNFPKAISPLFSIKQSRSLVDYIIDSCPLPDNFPDIGTSKRILQPR